MSKTRKMVFSALCVALGVVLPMVLHGLPGGGPVFLPMHIPVLLCGFLCGPWFGLICGALTPLLSSFTGMPAAPVLPGMMCELAVYGLVTGLIFALLRRAAFKLPRVLTVYVPLLCAMLAGRVVSGLTNGFLFRAGQYSLQMWLTASFVTALPGIIAQLILLPVLVLALQKAGLIPEYQKTLG